MKILLLKDIAGIGQKGALKEVSDGFALNKLIPSKQAVIATPEKIAEHERRMADFAKEQEKQEKAWREQKGRIEGAHIALAVNANTQGQLYEKVSAKDIAAALREKSFVIPVENIEIGMPIKHTGSWPVVIRLGSHEAKIVVEVTSKQ